MVLLLLISFACPVSAQSFSDENEMSAVELSIKRLTARVQGKTKIELADEVLSEMGMDEKSISALSITYKEEIASATSIYHFTEYVKVNGEGSEIVISEEEYEQFSPLNETEYLKSLDKAPSNEIHVPDDGLDSLFARELWIYKTLNAPSGTYGIIGTYAWKKTPVWRGTDVLSVSGDGLTFDRSSFYALIMYDYNDLIGPKDESISEEYTASTLNNASDLWGFNNAIAFKYNLPNNYSYKLGDTIGVHYPVVVENLQFMVIVSSRLQDPWGPKAFNIYFNYFHQKVGLGSLGVSVSANGANVSVSPKLSYDLHQIQTPKQIEYNP